MLCSALRAASAGTTMTPDMASSDMAARAASVGTTISPDMASPYMAAPGMLRSPARGGAGSIAGRHGRPDIEISTLGSVAQGPPGPATGDDGRWTADAA